MNYNQFPERLEPQLEAELLARFTSTHDPAVRKTLVEHNLRLVAHCARIFLNTGIEQEEFISVGTIGLIKAINTFNSQNEVKLATYASRCIENEMLCFLRECHRHSTILHLEDVIIEDFDGSELTLGDTIADDGAEEKIYDYEEAEAFAYRVCTALNRLSLKEIEIALLYAGGYTQAQIANMMGVSQKRISSIMQKFIIRASREHKLCVTNNDRDIFFNFDCDRTLCAMVNPEFRHKLEHFISDGDVKAADLVSGYTKLKLPISKDSYKVYASIVHTIRTA